jgi:methionyl-tRNA formyltransferase
MRTVFMGTPHFAVPCLEMLAGMSDIELQGVYTQPDRPKGRGYHLAEPPVKEKALQLELPVYQPISAKVPAFMMPLQEWKPELVVVVAYGLFLPSQMLTMPRYGCINVHASLLPAYRGAAPIQQCLIDGSNETGITTMLMDEGMDTGPILMQEKVSISSDETAVSLHDRLAVLGANTLKMTIHAITAGDLEPTAQNHQLATYAPRLTKESGRIDWFQKAEQIDALIRGTQPWPAAHTTYLGKMLKIWKAQVETGCEDLFPGTITAVASEGMRVSTGSGCLLVQEVQLEGKKRMTVHDFSQGNHLKTNQRLGV